jgi:ABC-type polysaccharide/polyol phosphate export permease
VNAVDTLPRGAAAAAHAHRRRAALRRPFQLVFYEVRTASAGSVLGLAWAVVQPLLYLGAYWFLLTVLDAKHLGPGGTGDQVLVLLSGLVAWLFFARAVGASMNALTRHAGLVKQTNFPAGVLPLVSVGVQAVDFVVGLALLVVVAAATGLVSWTLPLLLPVALLQFAFLAGVAALLAPVAVMLRDLRRLMQVALRAGMFLTPVLYLPAALPDGAMGLAYLNPAAYFVGLLRYAVTGEDAALLFDLGTDLAIACAMTVVVAGTAYALRRRMWRMSIDHL